MPPLNYTLLFLLILLTPSIVSVRFDLATLTLKSLKLIGDAHWSNGSIHLTRDLPVPNSGAGRALFSNPIRFLHPVTRSPIPFSTFFSFTITNLNPSSIGGGLAFIICSQNKAVGDGGGYLGIVNADDPNPSTIAVEFDTLMDVPFNDINSNHVGIDLNSMISASVADLDAADIDLKSGDLVNAWIDYSQKQLQISISYSTVKPTNPIIIYDINLAKYVNDFMYVGFSGSTQGSTESHTIDWWTFSSSSNPVPKLAPPPAAPSSDAHTGTTQLHSPPPLVQDTSASPTTLISHSPSPCQSNGLCKQGPAAVAGVATAGAFFIVGCAVAGFWVFTRKTRAVKRWSNLPLTSDVVNAPREFTYKELMAATRNFDTSRIIGHGAFGTVYKGIIPETGTMAAVKRCIQSNNQGCEGREEFLSELTIIASLRHRNLLKLQGWCCEKGEILLVYDYMLHGSLDKALYEPTLAALSWRHRKKILIGVASALAYLHRECERQVIHRDVKSSNVMLDQGYNARLGDFGLARQVDHDVSPDASVTAGTMGYLAPEYLLTGRATEQTDVFSFGAVVMEVVCGRRPTEGPGNNLVQWVWRLHGEGRVMEAVDGRMGGEFDEGEVRRVVMVGLGCSSSDPRLRPSMRSVVQMLSGEMDPPELCWEKRSMSLSTNHELLMSLQESGSDYGGKAAGLYSDCSSEDSLTAAVRP